MGPFMPSAVFKPAHVPYSDAFATSVSALQGQGTLQIPIGLVMVIVSPYLLEGRWRIVTNQPEKQTILMQGGAEKKMMIASIANDSPQSTLQVETCLQSDASINKSRIAVSLVPIGDTT